MASKARVTHDAIDHGHESARIVNGVRDENDHLRDTVKDHVNASDRHQSGGHVNEMAPVATTVKAVIAIAIVRCENVRVAVIAWDRQTLAAVVVAALAIASITEMRGNYKLFHSTIHIFPYKLHRKKSSFIHMQFSFHLFSILFHRRVCVCVSMSIREATTAARDDHATNHRNQR